MVSLLPAFVGAATADPAPPTPPPPGKLEPRQIGSAVGSSPALPSHHLQTSPGPALHMPELAPPVVGGALRGREAAPLPLAGGPVQHQGEVIPAADSIVQHQGEIIATAGNPAQHQGNVPSGADSLVQHELEGSQPSPAASGDIDVGRGSLLASPSARYACHLLLSV